MNSDSSDTESVCSCEGRRDNIHYCQTQKKWVLTAAAQQQVAQCVKKFDAENTVGVGRGRRR